MNKIDFSKYVDYIFCVNYLPNNRLKTISEQISYLGININDSRLFSFEFGIENKLFEENIEKYVKEFDIKFVDSFKYQRYMFEVGLNIYHILKIAQYKKYKRIIIFEDDIKVLKDLDYIEQALNYICNIDADYVHCDPNYSRMYRGIESYLLNNNLIEPVDNPYFYKLIYSYWGMCVYDSGFMILSERSINRLIELFEKNQITCGLDMIYNVLFLENIMDLNIYSAIKPLAIQEKTLKYPKEILEGINVHMNIDEYNI